MYTRWWCVGLTILGKNLYCSKTYFTGFLSNTCEAGEWTSSAVHNTRKRSSILTEIVKQGRFLFFLFKLRIIFYGRDELNFTRHFDHLRR